MGKFPPLPQKCKISLKTHIALAHLLFLLYISIAPVGGSVGFMVIWSAVGVPHSFFYVTTLLRLCVLLMYAYQGLPKASNFEMEPHRFDIEQSRSDIEPFRSDVEPFRFKYEPNRFDVKPFRFDMKPNRCDVGVFCINLVHSCPGMNKIAPMLNHIDSILNHIASICKHFDANRNHFASMWLQTEFKCNFKSLRYLLSVV